MLSALLLPASAWPVETIRGVCIKTIEGKPPSSRGIATPGLAQQAFVQRCDGSWARVHAGPDGLALKKSDRTARPKVQTPAMLPDGEITLAPGSVKKAWLSGPTGIYSHGILGDPVEASALNVLTAQGQNFTYRIDQRSVFEDLRVRLVDLDGDDREELVVIRSYLEEGSALSVFRLGPRGIKPLAETPPIGQPHRWLNPAGAADFDSDGKIEIAYVETPHIGGTLRVYQLGLGGLHQDHEAPGFSNHKMGSRVLDMSAVVDWNGDGTPDLAVPDATRRRMRVVGFAGGKFSNIARMAKGPEIMTRVLATDLDGDGGRNFSMGWRITLSSWRAPEFRLQFPQNIKPDRRRQIAVPVPVDFTDQSVERHAAPGGNGGDFSPELIFNGNARAVAGHHHRTPLNMLRHGVLEQTFDLAGVIDRDAVGRRHTRQSGHGHDAAADGDNESRAGGQPNLADADLVALRRAIGRGVG
jgi:hypothetical protein